MEETKTKTVIFGTLIFTFLLLFTFSLENELNYNNSKTNVIAKIDKSFTENLEKGNNNTIIMQGKMVRMFEAEFNQNATQIKITNISN